MMHLINQIAAWVVLALMIAGIIKLLMLVYHSEPTVVLRIIRRSVVDDS